MSVRVEHGDCLQTIPRLVAEGVVCEACVTDPPYHLTATQKRFGAGNAAPAQHGRDGAMMRLSGGFMGQTWDGGDIAFRPETWATVATILRPGAFVAAFGGTRTYHRLACAIEDGGFVIQDCIMWLFGTGFPKRRDMLKPAYEPIVLAYKPGGKRTMQIDECRIEHATVDGGSLATNPHLREHINGGNGGNIIAHEDERRVVMPNPLGRWPANVCHSSEDEVLAAFPDAPGALYDVKGTEPSERMGQNGIYGRASASRSHWPARRGKGGISTNGHAGQSGLDEAHENGGSAARFFYSAKAGAQDRWGSRHPTVKPVDLIAWLVKLVCPPDGLFLDPFAGSGTAGVAALKTGRNAILIERDPAYIADIEARMAFYAGEGRHSLAAKARSVIPRGNLPLFGDGS